MKKNHRFLVLALVLCGINAGTNAQTFTSNGINYTVTSTSPNEVEVAGNSGYSGVAVIPSSVVYNSNTYAVTAIGEMAFYNCSGLTGTLTIPNSVTAIGGLAFLGCSGLTGTLTIPNSVTAIGEGAFAGCSGLTGTLTIPNSVKTIGIQAFTACSGLTGIDVAADNLHYSSLDGVLFNEAQNILIQCPASKAGSYTIPESVDTIVSAAFAYCEGLTSVTIGNSVKAIGSYAFSYCSKLTSVTIGNSVETIVSAAFAACSGLTGIDVAADNLHYSSLNGVLFNEAQNILIQCPGGKAGSYTIPESVKTIGDYAFSSCDKLASVTIGNSVETIRSYAFESCSSLTSVTIGNSVETIGSYAFESCSSLTTLNYNAVNCTLGSNWLSGSTSSLSTLNIGNDVQTIPANAFEYCSKLASVTIGNSVDTIGDYAFLGCSGLTSVTIPNSVKTIGTQAFLACSGLTGTLTIPNSVTSIGYAAFAACSGLTGIDVAADNLHYSSLDGVLFNEAQNILIQCPAGKAGSYTIPESVDTIGGVAFFYCEGLTSVTIGNSVKAIGVQAFQSCSGLTGTLTIPNSVKTIGIQAFTYCSGLAEVTIGNSVETIGDYAFYECSGLKTVYVKAITPPAAYDYAFTNVPTGIPVHVPCGTKAAYKSAAQWSSFSNYIEALFYLTVRSEDATKGTASITQENTCTNNTAIIAATPLSGYQFKQWSDGNTDNPRTVTLTQDTVLTATFGIITGIDGTQATALALYPNPVRDELFISGISGEAKIVITDLSGRTVETWHTTSLQTGELSINLSALAKGVYLIKVGNQTGKIVKE
jgi:Flp pilus assembly protein protease CpaA